MTHPTDKHVGERIRARRKALRQTQESLADDLAVSFQQVQKYERGVNRVSASKLACIARAQGVHPGYYFEGLDDFAPLASDAASSWLQTPGALDLAQSMATLPPSAVRAIQVQAETLAGLMSPGFTITAVADAPADSVTVHLHLGGDRMDPAMRDACRVAGKL